MGRQATYKETLLYYDIPQIFSAKDQVGSKYLCYLLEENDTDNIYFCSPFSADAINDFKFGKISLRQLFEETPTGEYYRCSFSGDETEKIALEAYVGEVDDSILPDENVILEELHYSSDRVFSEAKKRNCGFVELAIEAPESEEDLQIEANTLGGFLINFQGLLKHAYKRAVKALDKDIRKTIAPTDPHLLYVTGFSEGSFTVEFSSEAKPDLIGQTEVSRALKKLDELTSEIGDFDKALEIVRGNQGHLAGAYIRLLEYMTKTRSSIRYTWADPYSGSSRVRRIDHNQASKLLSLLNELDDLGTETVVLTGRITKANSKNQTWTLLNEDDNKEYSGLISENASITMSGIVIQEKRYRLVCLEQLEEVKGTGKEKVTLHLTECMELEG